MQRRKGYGIVGTNIYFLSCCRTYASIANSTVKSGYRPDTRAEAIARASAIRQSQRPVKAEPESKVRGAKAKKAAAEKA